MEMQDKMKRNLLIGGIALSLGFLGGCVSSAENSSFGAERIGLETLDLMERRGSGFGKILDAYKIESEWRGRESVPIFRSDATDFLSRYHPPSR